MRLLILLLFHLNVLKRATSEFCDAEKCVNLQILDSWFKKISEPSTSFTKIPPGFPDLKDNSQPLVEITSCGPDEAIWNYKYVGGKGKRKMFSGKGKLFFYKFSNAPHGYDYGMKSGK